MHRAFQSSEANQLFSLAMKVEKYVQQGIRDAKRGRSSEDEVTKLLKQKKELSDFIEKGKALIKAFDEKKLNKKRSNDHE
jgi:hypothetical protein